MNKAIKYGDNIDTDAIMPSAYLNITDKTVLAAHCMEGFDPDFKRKISEGGAVIVAGRNFGCGSSREQAPTALKESGIALIIAVSFARLFYRNAINIGLPVIECASAAEEICEGHDVIFNAANGIIRNESTGKEYMTKPFPEFIQKIINHSRCI